MTSITTYTRTQLIEILELEDGLIAELESEEIVFADAWTSAAGSADLFSQEMLERARVAGVLIRDLGVNLEGVAIIVRLREEITDLQRELARLLAASGRRPAGRTNPEDESS